MDIDLDAYFARIRYTGNREISLNLLRDIAFAHATHIPFEGLDPLQGVAVTLAGNSVPQKLLHTRRGGYCFEQNGLLFAALDALGFQVSRVGARVLIGQPEGVITARTHLFVKVLLDGEEWLVDAGVGGHTPTAPIRFVLDEVQPSPHEPRRIIKEGAHYMHQVQLGERWENVCVFDMEPMHPIDCEVASWYTSTHPDSHFCHQLLVAMPMADGGRYVMQNNVLTIRDSNGVAEKIALSSVQEIRQALTEYFGIDTEQMADATFQKLLA